MERFFAGGLTDPARIVLSSNDPTQLADSGTEAQNAIDRPPRLRPGDDSGAEPRRHHRRGPGLLSGRPGLGFSLRCDSRLRNRDRTRI